MLAVFLAETASQEDLNSEFPEYSSRIKRQMEAFAARLAVVQPTKRDALSDDTPLSAEAMRELDGVRAYSPAPDSFFLSIVLPKLFMTQAEVWTIHGHINPMLKNQHLALSNGKHITLLPGIRTVGDLKALYRILTDRELEVKR